MKMGTVRVINWATYSLLDVVFRGKSCYNLSYDADFKDNFSYGWTIGLGRDI